jgi:hypothetical protein
MQAVLLVHDTDDKYVPVLPRGVALGAIDHLEPFHRSTSGTVGDDVAARLVPTAMQLFGLVHETATRALATVCCFVGLGTTRQPVPVHRSMSGRVTPFEVMRLPTAKHVAVARADASPVAHDTPSR